MTLVERFIEIGHWSITRKLALWWAMLLFWHLSVWAATWPGFKHAGFVDEALAHGAQGLYVAYLLVLLLVTWAAVRAGREIARWLIDLMVCGYCLQVVGLIHLFGSSSTPMAFGVISVTFLSTIFFDIRIGVVSFVTMLAGLLLVGVLESRGVLSYAPVLLDRSLDAQNNRSWFSVFYLIAYVQPVVLGFSTIALVVMARDLQERRLVRAQKLIRRYVPSQVADAILASGGKVEDRHERRKITIFFSDLVGFTDISEAQEPEDLSKLLNEYFSEMTRIAEVHGGTVDELAGDAILIFFGAPNATTDKDHALRAVRMALQMQQAVQALNARWKTAGIDVELKARMGINTGMVTLGNFGSPDRMKYTALGKHVNLAARLQSHCEPGRVLISHPTWLLVNDQVNCLPRGELTLKGIAKPVAAYEISPPA